VLWPEAGFAKGQAIDYYARVAGTILPHLRGRPLTRVRFPDGTEAQRFYEKRAPSHTPDWVRTAPIEMGSAGVLDFIVCNDRATLIWLAQLAALELHPSLSLADDPDTPTVVAFDLDPGEPASIVECARVGLLLRELFEGLGLETFPKTSGSKGLQVYLPLNDETGYERTKPFARAIAHALERSEPDLVVSRQQKALRTGKVLVDWSQNDRAKTTVAAYSLRCRQRPWVSTPLTWEEVESLVRDGDPDAVRFEATDVLERIERLGDLFAPVLELSQELPADAAG
jgi:bifunctional non-homologous end joining protein LigD